MNRCIYILTHYLSCQRVYVLLETEQAVSGQLTQPGFFVCCLVLFFEEPLAVHSFLIVYCDFAYRHYQWVHMRLDCALLSFLVGWVLPVLHGCLHGLWCLSLVWRPRSGVELTEAISRAYFSSQ